VEEEEAKEWYSIGTLMAKMAEKTVVVAVDLYR